MSNIVEQRITADEIYLRAGNGREFHSRRADVNAKRLEEEGKETADRAGRTRAKEAAVDGIRQAIVAALGLDMVNPDEINFDFDERDGSPTKITTGIAARSQRGREPTA